MATLLEPRASAHGRRDANGLYRAVMELIRFYQFRDRNRAVRHGLTVAHCHVLDLLSERTSISVGALAAAMYLDKSTVSKMIDGMIRRALIKRMADPDDGRGVLIAATTTGAVRYRRVVTDIVVGDYAFFADYTPATRRRVIGAIRKLTRLGIERDRAASRRQAASRHHATKP
jgi:DNA-binding MarR family transcriptional regulator